MPTSPSTSDPFDGPSLGQLLREAAALRSLDPDGLDVNVSIH